MPSRRKRRGRYAIWGRIGYEFARSLLEWRIDGGEWGKITHGGRDHRPDGTELLHRDRLAAIRQQELTRRRAHAGTSHSQAARPPKARYERLLFGLDALCLTPEEFPPQRQIPAGPGRPRGPRRAGGEGRFPTCRKSPPTAPARECRWPGFGKSAATTRTCPGGRRADRRAARTSLLAGHRGAGRQESLRDDLVFAHRIWYRTRVEVPAVDKGRSFSLVFPQNNLNTTVYVNGVFCGFEKHPFVHFQIDVTKAIKPGMNEIWVGIRDAWYGYSASPTDRMKLRRSFNMPLHFTHNGFQDLAYPGWSAFPSGILVTPTFVSAGRVYVSDVFCKPSVAKRTWPWRSRWRTRRRRRRRPARSFARPSTAKRRRGKDLRAVPFHLAARRVRRCWSSADWEKPQALVARRTEHVSPADHVRWAGSRGRRRNVLRLPRVGHGKGRDFKLNGFAWHGWNMGIPGDTKEKWLENYHSAPDADADLRCPQGGNRPFFGMTPDEALDWCDRNGVVVRRCGPLDGEAIGYFAIENGSRTQEAHIKTEIKIDLINDAASRWSPRSAASGTIPRADLVDRE